MSIVLRVLLSFVFFVVVNVQDKYLIKNRTDYYWGESSSENEKEAEDAALARLTKQIAVTGSSLIFC